jgi:hypothetical protein
MSELASTAAVGIESVEWLDGGNGNLTVQVTGRWRRRRPMSTAQVTLVIESEGRRHRFPATPEPPSVGGTGPGMWRLSFSVPGWLAPALGGHIWLSLGTVTVPLPAPGAAGPGPDPVPVQTGSPVEPELPPARAPEPEPDPASAPDVAARVTELERRLAVARSERDGLDRTLTEARARGEELERALSGLRSRQEELKDALGDARAEREELTTSLAEGERARRVAEQRAHAEQALRRDLARQLATAEREAERAREAMGELATAEDRIRTLERDLRDARRRGDEAEQVAAAAAARARAHPAEHARDPLPPPAPPPPAASATAPEPRDAEAARMRFEWQLRARRSAGGVRVALEPWGGLVAPAPVGGPAAASTEAAPPPAAVGAEPALSAEPPPVPAQSLVDTLRRELDARAAGDAALRSRLVAAETRLAARMLLERKSTETLSRLGEELEILRAALALERERRETAERRAGVLEHERRARARAEQRVNELHGQLIGQRERSREAHDAIGELRDALERLALDRLTPDAPTPDVPTPDVPTPDPRAPDVPTPDPRALAAPPTSAVAPVQAERLSDALSRLREAVAPPVPEDPEPASRAVALSATGPTLEFAFRRLVKRDAPAAGELLLDLLTLQRAAYPHPVAYDLVLGPGRGCVRVTVGEGRPSIERHGAARTREEIDFRVQGEPARIARLLTARGIWRRLGLRVARVRGRRDGLTALGALLTLPLDLAALGDGGAALRPGSVLALVAAMVDPAWTAGERFVVAHHDPGEHGTTYLEARDGQGLGTTRIAPAGRIAATITGPADALVTVLTGGTSDAAQITGDDGPLASLRTWVKRAQSG